MAKNDRVLSRDDSLGLATPMIKWSLAVTASTAVIVILFFVVFAKDQAQSAIDRRRDCFYCDGLRGEAGFFRSRERVAGR